MTPPSSSTTSAVAKQVNGRTRNARRRSIARPGWRDVLDTLATIALLSATLPLLLALSLIPRGRRDRQR